MLNYVKSFVVTNGFHIFVLTLWSNTIAKTYLIKIIIDKFDMLKYCIIQMVSLSLYDTLFQKDFVKNLVG